jgi:hypothetical protein
MLVDALLNSLAKLLLRLHKVNFAVRRYGIRAKHAHGSMIGSNIKKTITPPEQTTADLDDLRVGSPEQI